jgi:hypothetical protein
MNNYDHNVLFRIPLLLRPPENDVFVDTPKITLL